jgi:hypothetical protein
MTEIKNPPAFPNMAPDSCGPHIDKRDGMTLRDWFAGRIAPVILDAMARGDYEKNPSQQPLLMVAEHSYKMADAMLAERAK